MPKGNLVGGYSESFWKLLISVDKDAVGTVKIRKNPIYAFVCVHRHIHLNHWNNHYQSL